MGSLMAGWNSPVLRDPDTVRLERNKSLTRNEIDNFRRLHRKLEVEVDKFGDEPPSPSFSLPPSPFGFSRDSPGGGRAAFSKGRESASAPESPAANGGGTSFSSAGDWWTRSNWAFLNEPPRDRLQ